MSPLVNPLHSDQGQQETSFPKPKGKLNEKDKLDAAIISTNNSSIVSKRSVERLYSKGNERQFLRHFVKKPQRRSPIINRGYYLRMQAVEYVVNSFLHEELPGPKAKVVVNLGCGYDPLPFKCLSKETLQTEVLYVDIDYPDLIAIKASIVSQTPELHDLLTETQHFPTPVDHVHYQSKEYLALGCDLRDLETLQRLFEKHGFVNAAILFTAEVSLTYMVCDSVDALVEWAANLPDARFSVLEQMLPSGANHPFARTMLKHFDSLSTPLKSVSTYPQLTDQIRRYSSRGWKSVDACDLLAFWSSRIPRSERERVEAVEEFDEFEEFFCYCQHYFILFAHNGKNPHTPFYSPNIMWNGSGEYRRFPSRATVTSASSYDERSTGFTAEFSASPALKRRFGAAAAVGPDSLVSQGGQGLTSRLGTSLFITHSDEGVGIPKGNGPGARVCHTMTTLPNGKVLLVGGRTSPDKPLKDTWLLDTGVWRKVEDLPVARYRHAATAVDSDRILIYGGRGEHRKILGDWLLWSEDRGWREIPAISVSEPPPRFAAGICWTDHGFGALSGGLDARGDVLDDMWRLELHEEPDTGGEILRTFWSMVNVLSSRNLWKRFGGQMIYTGYGRVLYIGGISGCGLMKTENDVLEIDCNKVTVRAIRASFPKDQSPFLIGHSVVCLQDRVVVCGGGGVCFGFGACTNDGIWTLSDREKHDSWKFVEEGKGLENILLDVDTPMPDTPVDTHLDSYGPPPEILGLEMVSINSAKDFDKIIESGKPALLKDLDIGPCTNSWTPEYLKNAIGTDREIVVHVAQSSTMSFQQKAANYQTSFGNFIDAAFLSPSRLYFRSLSARGLTATPPSLKKDFPSLAQDFILPPSLVTATGEHHASSLHISSAGVGMWLHYDGMANIFCQISGCKLFRLYPPGDVTILSFPHGATTSTILDIFSQVSPPGTTPYNIELQPGDVLFIPPLWLYAAKPLTPCIAVNISSGSFDVETYHHGRDGYENRDLAAYEKGRKKVQEVVKNFRGLPRDARRFYLGRLAEELKEGLIDE